MSKKSDNNPAAENKGIPDDVISTSQEIVPVPLIIGERRVAVKWICEPIIDRSEKQEIDTSKK